MDMMMMAKKDLNHQEAGSGVRCYSQSGQDGVSDPEEWVDINFPQDRSWLETSDGEGDGQGPENGGSGEAADRAAEDEPMVVARPNPGEADGFDYESDG